MDMINDIEEPNTTNNVLSFEDWSRKLRGLRASEEARRAEDEEQMRINLLLEAFR